MLSMLTSTYDERGKFGKYERSLRVSRWVLLNCKAADLGISGTSGICGTFNLKKPTNNDEIK